ncbi:GTP cyclohydrolase 1 [Impatiens glandulifera]|uniref:GTP cyclohydrolase 1 n=1 Tax=Impatiens glandulifera TaxID=253017 RepID=UPI001FB18897|nr:GTP cyclohydrolase 1 [Impatiens glandulifera]
MSFSMCAIRMEALSLGTAASDEGHFHVDLRDNNNNAEEECADNSNLEEEGGLEETESIAIQKAVKVLLQGLGEDVTREGLRKTPLRVAKALLEGTRGYTQKVKDIVQDALFPEAGIERGIGNAGGSGGLVIVRDLHLFSYCASCLLPFHVKCHVGYIPSYNRVLGLSKLSRVADVFAKRLQNPQRLADQVCYALNDGISPSGVAVLLQCSHVHFPFYNENADDHKGWVYQQAISGSGIFGNENADIWGDFLSLLKFRGVVVNLDKRRKITTRIGDNWCPSHPKIGPIDSTMTMAVDSILRALGEDPTREELLGTPARFVKWLTNFKTYNVEMKLENGVVNGSSNNSTNCDELGVCSELNIPFWSQCEHHLLPFHGVVHIGYICGNGGVKRIGKQVLQSIVHFHGFKLQVQERLNRQIAETVSLLIGGGDVMVVIEASHTCMITRGIEKFGSSTATVAVLGRFSTDSRARGKFLESIPKFDTCSS